LLRNEIKKRQFVIILKKNDHLWLTILAFIPAIEPTLIWLPAAIIFYIQGDIIKGTILIVYCIVILGYLDHFLKPKLIGDKIKLSSFIIFLGVLGGLQVFGVLGLFFGPIIILLLVTCVNIYKKMGEDTSKT